MYEIMMYAGAAGCIIFFVLSVVLFVKNKIPASIMYFVNLRRKGVDIWSANQKLARQNAAKPEKTVLLQDAPKQAAVEQTVLLDDAPPEGAQAEDDHTELLEDIPADDAADAVKVTGGDNSAAKVTNTKDKKSKKKEKAKKQPKQTKSRPAAGFEPTALLGDTQMAGGSEPTELLDYIAKQTQNAEPTELLDDLPTVKGFQPTELLDDIPDYYTVGSQTELLD